jgi:hypothetical protein
MFVHSVLMGRGAAGILTGRCLALVQGIDAEAAGRNRAGRRAVEPSRSVGRQMGRDGPFSWCFIPAVDLLYKTSRLTCAMPARTPSNQPSRTDADVLRVLAEGTATATGEEFFHSLARCAAQALGARYAFVAETLSDLESRSLAFWEGSDFGQGFTYKFPGTPCRRVAAGHVCVTTTGLAAKFPEDLWLQQIGADSYVGVPLRNAQGRTIGHLAVLHTEPMEPSEDDISTLRIFAARGCAELERKRAEEKLHKAHGVRTSKPMPCWRSPVPSGIICIATSCSARWRIVCRRRCPPSASESFFRVTAGGCRATS